MRWQVRDKRTGRFVKVDRESGRVVKKKRTDGPFENIPTTTKVRRRHPAAEYASGLHDSRPTQRGRNRETKRRG